MFVLGAGADVAYGLPTIATLMRDLAKFARGEGAKVDRTLRAKLPYLRFTFDKYAGDQSNVFLARLFSDADDLAPTLASTIEKLKNSEELRSVGAVLEHLSRMAKDNRVDGADLAALARMAGTMGAVGDSEPLLDPQRLSLSEIPGSALRTAFQQALLRGTDLTDHEREVLEFFIVSTSNIEQLLSHYFTLYSAGRLADQRTYLYLAWMLWAYLQLRSVSKGPRDNTLYARLPALAPAVITFNYTNFFRGTMASRVKFFHGRLDCYLRIDDRTLIMDDPRQRAATSVDTIAAFLDTLRLDVRQQPQVDFPAIVPPISFKPVMSRAQLRVWVEADELLQAAGLIVIVGYSFAIADEHFNDLLRKGNSRSRVLVVDPNLTSPAKAACRIFGIDFDSLETSTRGGYEVWSLHRLTCVKAKAENIDGEFLSTVLNADVSV